MVIISQVSPANLPSPHAPAGIDTGLGELGRGISQVGDTATYIAEKAKHEADQVAVTGAVAQAESWQTTALYGDGKNVGFSAMGGPAAMKRGETIGKDYQAELARIRGTLNGDQVRMFDAGYASSAGTRFNESVQRQLQGVRIQYDDDSRKMALGELDRAITATAANGGVRLVPSASGGATLDDSAVRDLLGKKLLVEKTWADRNWQRLGVDRGPFTKARLEAVVADGNKAAVEALAATPGGHQVAQAYFEQHRQEFDPETRNAVQEQVTRAVDAATVSNAVSAALLTNFPPDAFDPPVAGVERPTVAERLASGDASIEKTVKDPTLQGKAKAQLRANVRGLDNAAKQQRGAWYDALYPTAEAGGIAAVERDPRFGRLDSKQHAGLRKAYSNGIKQDTDEAQSEHYYGLLDQAMSADPAVRQRFAERDLGPDRPFLKVAQSDELKSIQRSMKPGGDPAAYAGTRTRAGAVSDYVGLLYPDNEKAIKASKKDATAYKMESIAFRQEIDDMLAANERALGRKLAPKEIDALVGPLFAKIALERSPSLGNWFGLDTTEQLSDIGDIPKSVLVPAYEEVKAEGGAITDARVRAKAAEIMRELRGP